MARLIGNRKLAIGNAYRGCSSVGRAHGLQPWGQGFESPHLHQLIVEDCQRDGDDLVEELRIVTVVRGLRIVTPVLFAVST